MGEFLIYIIKSSLCLVLFYLFYKVLLSRDTFYRFNRFALLGLMVVSLVVPFIELPVEADTYVPDAPDGGYQTFVYTVSEMPATVEDSAVSFSWPHAILLLYVLGFWVCLIRYVCSLIRLCSIIRTGLKVPSESLCPDFPKNVNIIVHSDIESPFSWMNNVVIPETCLNSDAHDVLVHELAHVRARHSVDILFADFFILLQWFNPASWLMKSELQDLHEYEADDAVMRSGADIKRYQLMLIKNAVDQRLYSMVNSFNHSSLKKRITMMFKEKSSPWARMKYLYVLPLTAFAAVAFARPEISAFSNEISSVKVSDFVSFAETNRVENQNLAVADTLLPEKNQSGKESSYKVFEIVEDLPVFPGGDGEMKKFIDRNLHYPESAQDSGTEGQVMVQFTVQSDGSITDAHVLKGLGEPFDSEAVRVISSMPKWEPGKQRGKAVAARFSVPVVFRRSGNSADGVNTADGSPQKKSQSIVERTDVFAAVEHMPQFPGGPTALIKYLSNNIHYPNSEESSGTEGRVMVQFIVETDGSISDVQIKDGLGEAFDSEALRVVSSMPKWKPGMQRGKIVPVRFLLPITFRTLNKATGNVKNSTASSQEKSQSDSVYTVFSVVEQMPQFPGGQTAMMKYLADNLHYPKKAQENGVQGTVLVQFIIDEEGHIPFAKINKSVDSDLDAEALRVVKSMPLWIPGKQRGKKVKVMMNLPVAFRLKR